jgi:hypothetical protein
MAPPEFHHFTGVATQWHAMPSFVLGELLFIASALLALWHATRRGRDHQVIWLAALVAGTAIDLIFMALPLVDNFWQAQAMVMLTPRMPLYIPCVYVSFMYWPVVTVRRLGMPRLSGAALSGLAAWLFYAPYDIVGVKFLWWTWHDTDQSIAARVLGVPCSSSLWVLTFAGAFAWLLDPTPRISGEVSIKKAVQALAKAAGLSTLVMMLQMTLLQQLDGGTPRRIALAVGLALYALLAATGLRAARPRPLDGPDRVARRMLLLHFAALLSIGLTFRPETHVSTGIHQPVGPCHVEATDITGLTRYAFLCPADFDEDYTFDCAPSPPREGSTWYTICGRAHGNAVRWRSGLALLTLLGAGLFAWLWGRADVTSPRG